jgi:hypothetical protein
MRSITATGAVLSPPLYRWVQGAFSDSTVRLWRHRHLRCIRLQFLPFPLPLSLYMTQVCSPIFDLFVPNLHGRDAGKVAWHSNWAFKLGLQQG